jgi:hypothetical protein
MKGSTKRVLENFKALEPAQQERVKQALAQALETSALARAELFHTRTEAKPRSTVMTGNQSQGY